MRRTDWPGWTNWEVIHSLDFKTIPTGPGTYMIGCSHKLERTCGVDPWGILDIGQTKLLRKRISAFWGCASKTRKAGHMAGWRFAAYSMHKRFPLTSLMVCWRAAGSAYEAARHEGELLDEYVFEHLESPPLNYSASWRHLAPIVEPVDEEGAD